MFEREDWMLFRSLDSLGQKAGVGRDRIAGVVVKELVDNALDVAGRATLTNTPLPAGGLFTIRDEGPGIPGDDAAIAHLFSIRRGLLSTKLLRLPTRGALGNGLRVVMGAVAASGGGISVATRGRRLTLAVASDGATTVREREDWAGAGTEVTVRLGPDLVRDAKAAEQALILGQNAIALASVEGATRYEGKSNPRWYSRHAFFELCQGWTGTLADLCVHLAVKPTAVRSLREAHLVTRSFDQETAARVLHVLCEHASKVTPKVLGASGPGFRIDGRPTFYAKKAGVYPHGLTQAEVPFVVEVWAARRPAGEEQSGIRWFSNRTPTAAQGRVGRGERGKAYLSGCGLNHYVDGMPKKDTPVFLFVSVTSPWIPITTDGKEPNFEPIQGEIAAAIRAAVRPLKRPTGGVTKSQHIEAVLDEAVARASDRGAHRYSLRQLYYAVRGLLEGRAEMPDYGYFSAIVAQVEASRKADLPGIYRDARGVLYHPHTGEQIPLGTLGVEAYKRRAYGFHKVLYVEKGGFLPLLLDAKWPERHDCAILTSQGFASRAARDVIDLLGDGDEPLQFFCVHDADGPGTLIYETLREATVARRARTVEIHNLGLDPWEAETMGLQPETFERKRGRVPVAEYVRRARLNGHAPPKGGTYSWEEWLQTRRFELNAMTSGSFLRWLDRKIAPFERQGAKLVPPRPVLDGAYEAAMRAEVRRRLVDDLVRAHGVDRRVEEILAEGAGLKPGIDRIVQVHLEDLPAESWEQAVASTARYDAGRYLPEGGTP